MIRIDVHKDDRDQAEVTIVNTPEMFTLKKEKEYLGDRYINERWWCVFS